MIASAEANATAIFYELQESGGWDAGTELVVRGVYRGRLQTLSDTERVNAQTLERNSTHRFYTESLTPMDGDRVYVLGQYDGDYKLRTHDIMRAGGIAYQTAEIERGELVQMDLTENGVVKYDGEPLVYNGEVVTYAGT